MAKRRGQKKDKPTNKGGRIKRALLGTSAIGAVTYAVAKRRASKKGDEAAEQATYSDDREARRAARP